MLERKLSSGNIMVLACGPLRKKRYINPRIELELVEFKKEIEEKFEKSALRQFVMPKRKKSNDVSETNSFVGQLPTKNGHGPMN